MTKNQNSDFKKLVGLKTFQHLFMFYRFSTYTEAAGNSILSFKMGI